MSLLAKVQSGEGEAEVKALLSAANQDGAGRRKLKVVQFSCSWPQHQSGSFFLNTENIEIDLKYKIPRNI